MQTQDTDLDTDDPWAMTWPLRILYLVAGALIAYVLQA